ncbi:LacI family DNA-binding transcriptional regulator [Ancylobacter dichloromethanicus]|uniref:Transcriptional regulator n=1 Tax=Ancylobacter dichloromethanicus TaxID=518825 RepID=A0A9W6MZ61_9HYPH|nr:LacI family DNA-binding transcriptional regulator [Ancylobacter dichloromethanicus]MBS7554763.1 LacI family DNA-binding transcriptional regulator [Ancylobacter dichloromethanicus]GLK72369.1 transcriptional regulator [Ancylobacter dichloromethanicus]
MDESKPGRVAPTRATISDVARQAGVSIGTVSRVLNKARNVKPALQRRVLDAAAALDYRPDSFAQGMRSKKTHVIGVIVPDLRNPLSSEAAAGVEEELTQQGYSFFLANSRYERGREENILNEFARRRVDGIIAILARDQDPRTVEQLRRLPMPVVLLEREIGTEFDAVRTDQVQGTYRATRYLAALGHRRIALITVPTDNMSGRYRFQGYAEALADVGTEVSADLVHMGGYTRDYAVNAAYSVLSMRNKPTALIVSGGMLPGVLDAMRQLNLSIPDELSLVVLGDTELAALTRPGITAIRYDWAQTGRVAARLTISRIGGSETPPERVIVPYEFILRESCQELAPGD